MKTDQAAPAYIEVRLTLLPPSEGGRHKPVTSGYMPNVWLPSRPEPTLVSVSIELVDAVELAPGMTATARVVPFAPEFWKGIFVGIELTVTEGPEAQVGRAVVTRVVMPAMSAA